MNRLRWYERLQVWLGLRRLERLRRRDERDRLTGYDRKTGIYYKGGIQTRAGRGHLGRSNAPEEDIGLRSDQEHFEVPTVLADSELTRTPGLVERANAELVPGAQRLQSGKQEGEE